MNDVPKSRAIQPARAALAKSRRPMACPTLTAPADEIPHGTMNVKVAMLIAI